jgi:hypothetical protein
MKARAVIAAAILVVGASRLPAATIAVTSTADSEPGSLRDALASAADGDMVDASGVSGTILLTSGELLITNSVDIIGPGPDLLAVDGNAANRVFHIGPDIVVSISSLTITNGNVSGFNFPVCCGGGIYNDHATLTISNCTLSGNLGTQGGGIVNNGSSGSAIFHIADSTLSGNSGEDAGGILNFGFRGSATVEVANSTLRGNSAGGNGGGIFNQGTSGSVTLHIVNSTLSSNSAGGGGGGIFNDGEFSGSATVQIVNSTLSGNSAGGGGGISTLGSSGSATVQIVNSTLCGNSAVFGAIENAYGALEIGSVILKASASVANIFNTSGTVTSLGYNLSSDDGGGFLTATADQIKTNPMLGPLQDNGGPTFTHAILCGSPAIDQGKNLSGSATDQRGGGFVRTFDDSTVMNATGGDGTDIGAFEVQRGVCEVPAEKIGDLIALVQGFGLKSGTANSLIVKLQAAARASGGGNSRAACGNLGAFLNEVNAQSRKKLTTAQSGLLISTATRIRVRLGCS